MFTTGTNLVHEILLLVISLGHWPMAHKTDEIHHELNLAAHVSVIMPRAVDAINVEPALEITRRLGDGYEEVETTREEEN